MDLSGQSGELPSFREGGGKITRLVLISQPQRQTVKPGTGGIREIELIAQVAGRRRKMKSKMTLSARQRWMIKVVVERGEVVTAYRVKRLKQGEAILWQR